VFTQPLAHGLNEAHSETEGIIKTPRYITALACLRYSDLFASGIFKRLCSQDYFKTNCLVPGSWEGDVRLWKLDPKLKSFSLAGSIPAPGFVNSLQLVSPPREFFDRSSWVSSNTSETELTVSIPRSKANAAPSLLLVVGLGQEPRLGRWMKIKEGVANGTLVVAISPRTS
jgi:ribosomal RNA-processing protein 9